MFKPDDPIAVADVYAGDAARCLAARLSTSFSFVIDLEPEPDAFVRVAMIFNIANVAPRTVTFQRDIDGRATMAIEIPLRTKTQADMIRRKVAQLRCTISVRLTEIP